MALFRPLSFTKKVSSWASNPQILYQVVRYLLTQTLCICFWQTSVAAHVTTVFVISFSLLFRVGRSPLEHYPGRSFMMMLWKL